jgi:hypothetical protein
MTHAVPCRTALSWTFAVQNSKKVRGLIVIAENNKIFIKLETRVRRDKILEVLKKRRTKNDFGKSFVGVAILGS